ncbi:MAG: AraC family transcriptional regulator [Lachnospiraceae bacterium]|nr:AraC family transcriptional regulator [Lachnospiraceae bacterium]
MLVYDQYIHTSTPDCDDDVIVLHSGFCSTIPNYSYGKDTRDYYLIHFITSGKGVYSVGKTNYSLSKNDGFLITPDTTIVHTADKVDPWDLIWVAFNGKKVRSLLEEAGLDENHLIFHYEVDNELENLIMNIYNETRDSRNIALITGYFYLFIGCLIRANQNHGASSSNSSYSRFDEALNYLRRNVRSQISVVDLANCMRLDTSQIYRIFKKRTGKSPQKYICEMRIQEACELLEKTDLSVKEIAEWMDFEYQSHFTKQFKSVMGMSPSEYRNSKK